ncbi:MAG: CdaR family protein [Anaerolineaceae bacterium]
MKFLRAVIRFMPTLVIALILSLIVWVVAVSTTDPNSEVTYVNPVTVKLLGLDPELVQTGQVTTQVSITVNAPQSVHQRLENDPSLIQAVVNLSGLEAGTHELKPDISINERPTKITRVSPETLTYTLENLVTRTFDIELRQTGMLGIGFEAQTLKPEATQVQVTGPESLVTRITHVIGQVSMTNLVATTTQVIELDPLDSRGNEVSGVNLNPLRVSVTVPIRQLANYRNVVVNIVTTGQIARGYFLTGISANPPSISIYGTDPEAAQSMPEYIETIPLDLTGQSSSFETKVSFNIPEGIDVVGNQEITISVGIAPRMDTIQVLDIPVLALNLPAGTKVSFSPALVDIYVSGPMILLEKISSGSVKITIDLAGMTPGTYQLPPVVTIDDVNIRLDSVTPASVEVRITQ